MDNKSSDFFIGHVFVEIAAAPLAYEASLHKNCVTINHKVREQNGATETLWRDIENHLLKIFPSISVEELVLYRDFLWFSHAADERNIHLHEYITRIAKEFLSIRGTEATPIVPWAETWNYNDSMSDVIARHWWRWMTFALPEGLLIGALRSEGVDVRQVHTLSPLLKKCLEDKQYAESHQHIGASMSFPILWIATMRMLASDTLKHDAFASPGAELNNGQDIGPYLLCNAIMRYLLAAFLFHRTDKPTHFFTYLNQVFNQTHERQALMPDIHAIIDVFLNKKSIQTLSYPYCQHLYNQLTSTIEKYTTLPNNLVAMYHVDPLSVFFQADPKTQLSADTLFIGEAIKYCKNTPDAGFQNIFWACIRVQCIFFRHVVQRPMVPGLQWFLRHYSRMTPGKQMMGSRLLTECSIDTSGYPFGLKSLEFRTTPFPSVSETYQFIREVEAAHKAACRREKHPFELGIVFHFSKNRGGGVLAGKPNAYAIGTEGDPRTAATGYRYATYYDAQKQRALALATTFELFPEIIQTVRGLDVCTDELGIPTWVIAPLFEKVLVSADQAASKCRQKTHGGSIPLLRKTAHAGEHFVHLLGGLRRVDEAIEQFKLVRGDRIGHGIALGVNPEKWVQHSGQVPMTLEARFFDLIWAWDKLLKWGSKAPLHAMETEIRHLSNKLFGENKDPKILVDIFSGLTSMTTLRSIGFPHGTRRPQDKKAPMLWRYLCDPNVFKRGKEVTLVKTAMDLDTLIYLQEKMKNKVGKKGLTIETNPSSNLLIANLTGLDVHPIWYLKKTPSDADRVSVCVGSDDPLTFNTHIKNEFQLVYDAMIMQGISDTEAMVRLNELREAGLSSRFTLTYTEGNDSPKAGITDSTLGETEH